MREWLLKIRDARARWAASPRAPFYRVLSNGQVDTNSPATDEEVQWLGRATKLILDHMTETERAAVGVATWP